MKPDRRSQLLPALAVLALAAIPASARQPAAAADEPAAAAAPDLALAEDRLRLSLSLNVWATSVNGTIEVRGRPIDVDASFVDIVQDSDSVFGFNGRIEVGKHRWSGYLDGTYMNVGIEDQPTPTDTVDIGNEIFIVELGAQYRAWEWDLDKSAEHTDAEPGSGRKLALDIYGGVRYYDVSVDVDFRSGAPSRGQSKDWWDPLIGARGTIDITRHWQFALNGDVGGFGVGSDFAWAAGGIFAYRFDLWGKDAAITFGYRALSEDYSDGSGTEEFKWDVILHGPIVGFTINF